MAGYATLTRPTTRPSGISPQQPIEQRHAHERRHQDDAVSENAVRALRRDVEQPGAHVLRGDLQRPDQQRERRRFGREQALDRIGDAQPGRERREIGDEVDARGGRAGRAAEPIDDHRRTGHLDGAAKQARQRADSEGDREDRLAVVAPPRGEHDHHRQHQAGDEPAQPDRIRMLQDEGAELGGDQRRRDERKDLPPGRLPPDLAPERHRAEHVHDRQRWRRQPRPVEHAHQRHVDEGRAEAGKTPHQPGQHRDGDRQGKARIGDGGSESRGVGEKTNHERGSAKEIFP